MNVHVAKNGEYWVARWRDEAGVRRSLSLGHKADLRKSDAWEMCRMIEAKLARGEDPRAEHTSTLQAWLDKYDSLRTDLSEAARNNHERVGRELVKFFGGDKPLKAIVRDSTADWAASIGEGRAENTVRAMTTIAHTIFEHALRRDLVDFNPFDRLPRGGVEVDITYRHLTMGEFSAILEHAADWRVRNLFALCRWAGLRRGEALRLAWGDIDWHRHTLTVQNANRRKGSMASAKRDTKRKTRTVPLEPALYKHLEASYADVPEGTELVCGGLAPYQALSLVPRAIRAAGVADYGEPLQSLRAMRATDWYSSRDVDVMTTAAWMGHSPAVAMKHYHKPKEEVLDAVTGRKAVDPKVDPKPVEQTASTSPTHSQA